MIHHPKLGNGRGRGGGGVTLDAAFWLWLAAGWAAVELVFWWKG